MCEYTGQRDDICPLTLEDWSHGACSSLQSSWSYQAMRQWRRSDRWLTGYWQRWLTTPEHAGHHQRDTMYWCYSSLDCQWGSNQTVSSHYAQERDFHCWWDWIAPWDQETAGGSILVTTGYPADSPGTGEQLWQMKGSIEHIMDLYCNSKYIEQATLR